MKSAAQKAAATVGPARVEFNVSFSPSPRTRREKICPEVVPAPLTRETNAAVTLTVSSLPRPQTPPPTSPVSESAPLPRPPKIVLLLVLGHYWERLVRDGVVKDYAEIARRTGLTRARVTQICNLTLLAPAIQEEILSIGPEPDGASTERLLRVVGAIAEWAGQCHAWRRRRGR